MSVALYPRLKADLTGLADDLERSRAGRTPDDLLPAELESKVKTLWGNATSSQDDAGSSSVSRPGEVLRSLMEVLGRDLVVSPLISGQISEPLDEGDDAKQIFQTTLGDRLDLTLTLYEVVYEQNRDTPLLEPGAIFIPLLEELVELISVDNWRLLWSYVETRSKRFTKDMPASKGKALPLLRTINAFLRFLSRTPEDLVFRGRVHQFASSVISIADKSAINMRGDYGELKTTWDEDEGDGDVDMGDTTKAESEDGEEPERDLYTTLWSLQQYFASPPSLAGPPVVVQPDQPIPAFDDFKVKSDFVLPKLYEQTQKAKEMMGKEKDLDSGAGSKRKREDSDTGFFHPRYLTGKRLFEHELADTSFRRQILVQYFILFQFLLNLTPASASKQAFTGGMPKDFVLDSEKESWVRSKISSIREELKKMPGDGSRFEEICLSIIGRERHYAQWKNEGCPEAIFEIPPLDPSSAQDAATKWAQRSRPKADYRTPWDRRGLADLWRNGYTSLDDLKAKKRWATVAGVMLMTRTTRMDDLAQKVSAIEEEEGDNEAMGIEVDAAAKAVNADRKLKLNWRAIRLASQSNLRHFSAFSSSRRIGNLFRAIEEEERRKLELLAKAAGQSQSETLTNGTPEGNTPNGVDAGVDDDNVEGMEPLDVKPDELVQDGGADSADVVAEEAAGQAEDVAMDDPEAATGDEPDAVEDREAGYVETEKYEAVSPDAE